MKRQFGETFKSSLIVFGIVDEVNQTTEGARTTPITKPKEAILERQFGETYNSVFLLLVAQKKRARKLKRHFVAPMKRRRKLKKQQEDTDTRNPTDLIRKKQSREGH